MIHIIKLSVCKASFLLALSLSQFAIANDQGSQSQLEAHAAKIELANIVAPVKSAADLQHFSDTTPADRNPLLALSPEAQARFLKSLTFSETGLSSFYYGDIVRELNAVDAYRLLALFGQSDVVSSLPGLKPESVLDGYVLSSDPNPTFLEGYKCDGPGTCKHAYTYACTSNC